MTYEQGQQLIQLLGELVAGVDLLTSVLRATNSLLIGVVYSGLAGLVFAVIAALRRS